MKRIIEFKGIRMDANRQIESVRPIAEKNGIDLDKLDTVEALFVASKIKNVSIPELLGFETR